MDKKYDFSGWATRTNLQCSDGRVIMKDAFKDCDGKQVPLVWNHCHNEPDNVLGYAILHNTDEGVRAECSFNSTPGGQTAKELVEHGDINQLSIYANRLKENGKNVVHGIIREVSLVLSGANPGAYIDSVVAHSDGTVVEDHEQGILFTGENIELYHSDDVTEESEEPDTTAESELQHEDDADTSKSDEDTNTGETLRDIFASMTDKQQVVVMAMLEEAAKQSTQDNEKEEDTNMKHNVFDQESENREDVLTHSDGEAIIKMAKSYGGSSLKAAFEAYTTENNKELAHADLGFENISKLFPEYEDVKSGAPEALTTDQGWISKVLAKVHKSPISRIRTRQVDARDISERRAKGYTKQSQKKDAGNLKLLDRTTDPITVYIRSKLDRDDIIDITDFDVVQYMYNMDRMNLNEELARQIMIGDGRSGDGEIDKTKIRPIWLDDDLYAIHRDVDLKGMTKTLNGSETANHFGENYIYAEAVIESLLYAREKYRGSGNPDFYCTPHLVNVMLLARDLNGRRIYDNVNELKAALNVNEIVTAEQFEEQERTTDQSKKKKLLGIMVNLADYSLGATKGGQITHFTDFDINFNQEVSLLETRCSGALTRVMSAIVLEEDTTEDP